MNKRYLVTNQWLDTVLEKHYVCTYDENTDPGTIIALMMCLQGDIIQYTRTRQWQDIVLEDYKKYGH